MSILNSAVSCWPGCAVAGQLSAAWAARPSAGVPPAATPSVATTTQVVRSVRSWRSFSRRRRCHLMWEPPMAVRSRAREGVAAEGAADLADVALTYPQGVPNVTGAIAIDIAHLWMRELAALPDSHVELRDNQRVADVHGPIPVHIAALDEARYGARGRHGRRRRGRARRGQGQEVLRFDRAEAGHEVIARASAVGAVEARRDVVERRRSAAAVEQGARVSEGRPTHLLAQLCEEAGPLGRRVGGTADGVPQAPFEDVVAGRGVRLQRDIGNETL